MSDRKYFKLGDFVLYKGMTIPNARLGYVTFGELAPDKSNLVLYPNSFAFTDEDTRWLVGPGSDYILDSSRYFIVIPNMLGNGVSSSPSNCEEPLSGGSFPLVTHVDNVRAQRRLISEVFGVEKLALVYGWSMGAQQALHWGAIYPEQVERICAICGTARTTPHTSVFLDGLKAILTLDHTYIDGTFTERPVKVLRAVGRFYAGWAMSQAFYRQEAWRNAGFSSLEDFIVRVWEANFLRRDAGNLLSMIATWRACDISDNELYKKDLSAALASIKARTVMISSATDLYFTPEDIKSNAEGIPDCSYLELDTVWGHRAGHPIHNSSDADFIRNVVRELLSR